MLVILRYHDEFRKPESYFDNIKADAKSDAVKLAVNLIEDPSGKFEPQSMRNEYGNAVHELVQAKIEQPTAEVVIGTEKREAPKVVNIMDALKKSMQARGQAKSAMQCAATWVKPRQRPLGGHCIRGCRPSNSGEDTNDHVNRYRACLGTSGASPDSGRLRCRLGRKLLPSIYLLSAIN